MKFSISAALILAVSMLASCAQQPQAGPQAPATAAVPSPPQIQGTVLAFSNAHGNVYTSIRPDQYEPLGLVAGKQVQVAFGETELTLTIGRDYADVSSGMPLAVLHREGLTFAIRDGNFSRTYGITAGATFQISPVVSQDAGAADR